MAGSKIETITSDAQLTNLINTHKTVVIDFHAKWCGPCKLAAPVYDRIATELTIPGTIVFTKCDVDECQEVAKKYNITAMPTFLIFKEKQEVSRIQGADMNSLKAAAQKLVEEHKSHTTANRAVIAKGYVDISDEIEKPGLDIMNANSELGDVRCLFDSTEAGKNEAKKDWVESDTDEQLMIYIPFLSTLKIHSLHITSLPPPDNDEDIKRPKKLKLYANRPTIVGFDEAESINPTQEVTIDPASWDKKTGTAIVQTRFVKFQSVFSLTIFVEEGEDGCEKTRIDRIRVVGEAGEKRDLGKLEKMKDGHD